MELLKLLFSIAERDQQARALKAALDHAWWAGFGWGAVATGVVAILSSLAWYVTKDEKVRREFWRFGKSRSLP